MAADSFHEKPLRVWQSKDLFGKGVKPGFAQLFRLRCDTLDGCATGDEPVRPLAPFSLFVVGGAVLKALDFVLLLRKLPLHLLVPSRFMRKFICRLRLNEVSRQ